MTERYVSTHASVHLLCTLWSIKNVLFVFLNNFGNCRPMLAILSLLHYQMNCRKSWNKIYLKSVATLPTMRKLNVQLHNFTACYSMQM